MADSDDVAVSELPFLHRGVVHGGAVGGVQVGQHGDIAVPADLHVPTRDAGVGEPELGVLTAADDIGALTQLEGAVAAVLEV